MHAGAGGQLDDVSVRVAEIDRPDKAMIDRAAHLFSFRLRFSQHRFEDVVVDGAWKIARRKLVLDQNVLSAKNVSIFF